MKLPRPWLKFLIRLDLIASSIIFPRRPVKLISYVCGEELASGKPCAFCWIVCKVIDWIVPNHCARVYLRHRHLKDRDDG
jgi:hypothetical protein